MPSVDTDMDDMGVMNRLEEINRLWTGLAGVHSLSEIIVQMGVLDSIPSEHIVQECIIRVNTDLSPLATINEYAREEEERRKYMPNLCWHRLRPSALCNVIEQIFAQGVGEGRGDIEERIIVDMDITTGLSISGITLDSKGIGPCTVQPSLPGRLSYGHKEITLLSPPTVDNKQEIKQKIDNLKSYNLRKDAEWTIAFTDLSKNIDPPTKTMNSVYAGSERVPVLDGNGINYFREVMSIPSYRLHACVHKGKIYALAKGSFFNDWTLTVINLGSTAGITSISQAEFTDRRDYRLSDLFKCSAGPGEGWTQANTSSCICLSKGPWILCRVGTLYAHDNPDGSRDYHSVQIYMVMRILNNGQAVPLKPYVESRELAAGSVGQFDPPMHTEYLLSSLSNYYYLQTICTTSHPSYRLLYIGRNRVQSVPVGRECPIVRELPVGRRGVESGFPVTIFSEGSRVVGGIIMGRGEGTMGVDIGMAVWRLRG